MTGRRLALIISAALACTANQRPADPTPAPPPPPPPPSPQIPIRADYPGADAMAVERDVTAPLEQAVAAVPDITGITSTSRPGRAELRLDVDPAADPPTVRMAVMHAIQAIQPALPSAVLPPILGPDPDPRAAVVFTLDSEVVPADELRRIAGPVRDAAFRTPGVVDVAVCGGRESHVRVGLDTVRLATFALSLDAVVRAFRDLHTGPRDLEDLAALAVRTAPTVRLRDLATISIRPLRPDCDAVRSGGRSTLVATVHARRGASLAEFTASVRAALAASPVPPGVTLGVHDVMRRAAIDIPVPADADRALTDAAARIDPAVPAILLAAPAAPGAARHPAELLLLAPADAPFPALPPDLRVRAIGGPVDAYADPAHRVAWVRGPDLDVDAALADRLAELARTVPGVALAEPRDHHILEMVAEIRRERLAEYSVDPRHAHDAFLAATAALEVSSLRTADRVMPVILAIGDDDLTDLATRAHAVPVAHSAGIMLLGDLIEVRSTDARAAILHRDRQRTIAVDLRFADQRFAHRDRLEQAVARDLQLPPGLVIVWD